MNHFVLEFCTCILFKSENRLSFYNCHFIIRFPDWVVSVFEIGPYLLVGIPFALFGTAALVWNSWISESQCFHLRSLKVSFYSFSTVDL